MTSVKGQLTTTSGDFIVGAAVTLRVGALSGKGRTIANGKSGRDGRFVLTSEESLDTVEVEAKTTDGRVARSGPIRWSPELTVDLTLEDDARPESEAILAKIEPYLEGRALGSLSEEEAAKLSVLSGTPPARILSARTAARAELLAELPFDVRFAVARFGLIEAARALGRPALETIVAGLERAREERVLTGADLDIDATARAIVDAVVNGWMEALDKAPALIALWADTLGDRKDELTKLTRAYLEYAGPADGLIDALPLPEDVAPGLKRDALLLGAAGGRRDVARALRKAMPDVEAIEELLRASGDPRPLGMETVEDEARRIADAVERTNGFATSVRRIIAGEGKLGADDALAAFLKANPSLDLDLDLDTVEVGNVGPTLAALQRALRLGGNFAAADRLISAKLDAPDAIVSSKRSKFVTSNTATLGLGGAARIYDRASETVALVAATVAENAMDFGLPNTVATPPPPASDVTRVPNAAELFGDLDTCECDPCVSVFSPSAYLVDLLEYLRREAGGAALAELRQRRPDVTALELSCENERGRLPAIDIVNEVFEETIAREAGRHAPPIASTVGTEQERFAHPQRIIRSVYDNELFGARFPFELPLDLRTEELRAYLGANGSSRREWMELMVADPDAAVSVPQIAHETLGLTTVDATILTATGWHRSDWGLALGQSPLFSLTPVDRLMRATGLSFADLTTVLGCRFVSGSNDPVAIQRGAPCRIEAMRADLGEGSLIRLHRFLRLQRAVGWSHRSLDRVLVALGALSSSTLQSRPVDDALLVRVSQVKRIAELLGEDPVGVANWWSSRLDTHVYGASVGAVQVTARRIRFNRAAGSFIRTERLPVVSAFSVLVDLTVDTLPPDFAILSSQQADPRDVAWSIAVASDGAVRVAVGDDSRTRTTAPGVVQAGVDVRLGVVFDGAVPAVRVYVDGQETPTQSSGPALPAAVPSGAQHHSVSDATRGFDGVVRSVAVFHDALGDTRVRALQGRGVTFPLVAEPGLALLIDPDVATASGASVPDVSGNGRSATMMNTTTTLVESAAAGSRPYPTLSELLAAEELAPYYAVFMDRAAVSGPAPSFPLDPASLEASPRVLDDAIAAIAAALDLSEPALREAVEVVFGLPASDVALSEENLALLYKNDRLRRGLRLGIQDYGRLLGWSRINPFVSPAHALAFIRLGQQIDASPLTIEALDRLLLAADEDEDEPPVRRRECALDLHRIVTGAMSSGPGDIEVRDRMASHLGLDVEQTWSLLEEVWQPGSVGTPIVETIRALAVLSGAGRPPDAALAPIFDALARVERVAELMSALELSAPAVAWCWTLPWADDLRSLPVRRTGAGRPPLPLWRRLLGVAELDATSANRDGGFVDLLPPNGPADEAGFWAAVVAATGWPQAGLAMARRTLAPGATYPDDFVDGEILRSVGRIVRRAGALGVTVATAAAWGDHARPSASAVTDAIQSARGDGADEARWEDARAIRDELRVLQRDALVAFLLSNPPARVSGSGRGWETAADLFDYFLLDPLVTPAVETSRIASASSSVQRLVQRTLANLEPGWTLDDDAAEEWTWRKAYRVWEANRRVFVYPENWVRPELRLDKSELFRQLESNLRQEDFGEAGAVAAISSFLTGLQEVGNLEVMALYSEPKGDLHILARTRVEPTRYYYRSRRSGRFSPWERVKLDIQGAAVSLCVADGRVFIGWVVLHEEGGPGQDPSGPILKRIELQAAYGERRDGVWVSGGTSKQRLRVPTIPLAPSSSSQPAPSGRDAHRVRLRMGPGVNLSIAMLVQLVDDSAGLAGASVIGLHESFRISLVDGSIRLRGQRNAITRWFYFGPGMTGARPANQILEAGTSDRHVALTEGSELANQLGTSPGLVRLLTDVDPTYRIAGEFTSQGTPQVGDRFFLQTTHASFLVEPEYDANLGATSQFGLFGAYLYRFAVFGHARAGWLRGVLAAGGASALYHPRTQLAVDDVFRFADFAPNPAHVDGAPSDALDFDLTSPTGAYNWELYFFAPVLIAERLKERGRFAEAQRWLHFVFDPTAGGTDRSVSRFWRFRPLNELQSAPTIRDLLALMSWQGRSSLATERRRQLERQLASWMEHPFEPHRIAELRLGAYQKSVFMRYLDLLVAWGDDLFGRGQRETTEEALQLYMLASQLLGPRPRSLPAAVPSAAPTYDALEAAGLDAFSNAVWNQTGPVSTNPPQASPQLRRVLEILAARSAFCVPPNPDLLRYWTIVEDRLFKIRNALGIDGAPASNALFAPPIDPALLVRARAAGVRLDDAIAQATSVRFSGRRFEVLMRSAIEHASELRNMGQTLAAALERRDAEQISALRVEQDFETAKLGRASRESRLQEAQASLQALRIAREQAVARRKDYVARTFMNDEEQSELNLLESAQGWEVGGSMFALMGSVLSLIPDTTAGVPGGVTFGGAQMANVYRALGDGMRIAASEERHAASRASRMGSYERRREEWQLQIDQAGQDVSRIEREIVGAELRIAIAAHELKMHDQDVEHRRDVDARMRTKFSNAELYDWTAAQLGAAYHQAYELAMDYARSAEAAYRFETQDPTSSIIQPTYWDGGRRGLLASERLLNDLRRLQAAYLEATPRELRIVSHLSLAAVDPGALVTLRHRGEAVFELPETLFDADHPGHFMRRLQRVGVTIPAVTGAYDGVHATLTLEESWVRTGGLPASAHAHDQTSESIVTSTGRDDAMWEARELPNGLRAPFEGRGAIGRWRLRVDPNANGFPLTSIPDVVLHLTYTAREGSAALVADAQARSAAMWPGMAIDGNGYPTPTANAPGRRVFSVRQEYPDEWLRFTSAPTSTPPAVLSLTFEDNQFSRRLRNRNVDLQTVRLIFLRPENSTFTAVAGQTVDVRVPGSAGPQPTSLTSVADLPTLAVPLTAPIALGSATISVEMDRALLASLGAVDVIVLCGYAVR